MPYLLRYAAPGREPQPGRGLVERDLVATLSARLPGARLVPLDAGRLLVETEADATEALRALHGLSSFSPCVRCRLADLERTAIDVARRAVEEVPSAPPRTFAVRCKRVGNHDARSVEIAGRLGAAVRAAIPSLAVDLAAPDLRLGVEIRDEDCFVYTDVVPGRDQGAAAPAPRKDGKPRFLADQMLGTLATWLRMLGYDTVYVREQADSFLLRQANAEHRILLTRDRPLAERGAAEVLYIESGALADQIGEVLGKLALRVDPAHLFSRCSLCNAPLERVEKSLVGSRVPPRALALYDEFTRCPACDKVYWRGGHYRRMLDAIDAFVVGSAR